MKRYGKVLVASASALAVLGVGSVASANGQVPPPGGPSGTHEVQPEASKRNLACTDVQPDGAQWNELKFDGLWSQLRDVGRGGQRQFTQKDDDGPLEVTVTVKVGSWDQQTFDWVSDSETPVSAVIVKGGTSPTRTFVNVYEYDEPVTSDTDLHAPINVRNSMEPFDLKKIRFCYEEEDEDETTTTTVDETTTTTVEETTTTTVEETTTTTVEETTTTTAPPEGAAPPPAPPAQPVNAQPNFVG